MIWHFTDDQGCRLRFRSVPGIGSRHAHDVGEMKGLIRAARAHGITLVPEIASLGHSRYITRLPQYRHLDESGPEYSGMCPVHPQTREVIAALVRETIEIFDGPEVHVGLDEVDIGRHPLTRAALATRSVSQLVGEHVQFVRDLVVTQGGREMWMWGDGMLASQELMDLVPRDVVVCNWNYGPAVDGTSTRRLLDAGFDVITGSALLSHDQTLFPSSGHALANVRAHRSHADLRGSGGKTRVRGEIITTWFPCRSVTDAQWLGWHLACDGVRGGAVEDVAGSVRSFGEAFHGLVRTDDWAAACGTLLDLAPRRREWLAVLKVEMDALSADILDTLGAKADALESAVQSLRAAAIGVIRHPTEFAALQLLVDLLAHAYRVAATVNEHGFAVQHQLGERVALLDRLDAAWDRERFADDPTRGNPVIDVFRDDHLLIAGRDGLGSLARQFANAPRPLLQASPTA